MIARSSAQAVYRSTPRLASQWICSSCRRAYSEAASPAPALLLKLRNDLKTAMRAKDTSRLNVLKGVLAEVTNASKTNNPIQTDVQLLSLLRKRSTAAKSARDEFQTAGREDLVQKEEEQAAVLDEYASSVDLMSPEDVLQAVKDTVLSLRSQDPGVRAGNIMKALFGPGGKLDGKPVDKSIVPGFVKQVLSSD